MNFARLGFSTTLLVLFGTAGLAHSLSKEPPRPLADRVKEAEKIFVGLLVDRVEKGDWVRADLLVETPLRGVEAKARVEVIWRKRVGDSVIYDASTGKRGVALLKDKHEGRYWLREDKFESLERLEAVKACLADGAGVPSFEEWVEAGKPLPKDRMWTGGTPWFDESTGKRRSDEEVYGMIHGEPAKVDGKSDAGREFPDHWGDPPKIQTRDLRPLPGGYGKGSSTLAKWIEENMAKDAAKTRE